MFPVVLWCAQPLGIVQFHTKDVSLDFLVRASDEQLDKSTMNRILELQKLPEDNKNHIFYTLDNLIKAAKLKAL